MKTWHKFPLIMVLQKGNKKKRKIVISIVMQVLCNSATGVKSARIKSLHLFIFINIYHSGIYMIYQTNLNWGVYCVAN